jgi:hypothetical protein
MAVSFARALRGRAGMTGEDLTHMPRIRAVKTAGTAAASPRWHWISLLLLPGLVTVAVPDWMYSPTSAIDAWVYHGFFRHIETYAATMFPGTYYGTRLGWIVPGYVAYHMLEPQAARVILHLTFYFIAVVSLYAIVRRVSGTSSALFAAMTFGLYLPTIHALGWDYVDGAVIAYSLLTMALALAGLERANPRLTFASGIAAGAMLHSNIGTAFLCPSILVWFVPRRTNAWQLKPLAVQVASWGAGIVACTVMLGAASAMAGGEWAFFMPSFTWMIGQGWTNPWDVTGFSWIAKAPWVFLPAAVFVASLVAWLQPERREQLTPGGRRAAASLILCGLIFAAWDYAGNGALLYTPYYTSWLLPLSFIAIGAVLAPAAAHVRFDVPILLGTALAMVVSLVWPSYTRLPIAGFTGFAITIGLIGVAALVRTVTTQRLAILAAVVCLHGSITTTPEYGPSPDKADGFQVINRGLGIVDRYITAEQPRFLLTPAPNLGHYIQGLTSVYLWGYTIATNTFPVVAPEQARRIRAGTRVVVIAEQEDAAAPFDAVFAPYGVSGHVMGNERLMTEHGPLYLTFLEAVDLGPGDTSQSADSQAASPTPDRP